MQAFARDGQGGKAERETQAREILGSAEAAIAGTFVEASLSTPGILKLCSFEP